MNDKTNTVMAVRYIGLSQLRSDPEAGPGAFTYSRSYNDPEKVVGMHFICPCGCGNISYLNFDPEAPGACWQWDGKINQPTLKPSVFNTGMPCKWHGWLKEGVWESV